MELQRQPAREGRNDDPRRGEPSLRARRRARTRRPTPTPRPIACDGRPASPRARRPPRNAATAGSRADPDEGESRADRGRRPPSPARSSRRGSTGRAGRRPSRPRRRRYTNRTPAASSRALWAGSARTWAPNQLPAAEPSARRPSTYARVSVGSSVATTSTATTRRPSARQVGGDPAAEHSTPKRPGRPPGRRRSRRPRRRASPPRRPRSPHRPPQSAEAREREGHEVRHERGHDRDRDGRAGRRDQGTGEHRRPGHALAARRPARAASHRNPIVEHHRHEVRLQARVREAVDTGNEGANVTTTRPGLPRETVSSPIFAPLPEIHPAQQQGHARARAPDPTRAAPRTRDATSRRPRPIADGGAGERPRRRGGACEVTPGAPRPGRPPAVGFRPTAAPTASSASAFAAAVPLDPVTIAPAWPIRLPGGASNPAM